MAEQRLPAVNGDDGQWGEILNQFIEKEHFNTGADNALNGSHKTINIRPGSTFPGTAPLKFNSGPLMSLPEVGAVEFNNDKLYFTQTTSTIRKTIAAYDDSLGSTGDLYYRDLNSNMVRLPIGSEDQVIKSVGGLPSWTTMFSGLNTITVSSSAPSSPNIGDLWIDTN